MLALSPWMVTAAKWPAWGPAWAWLAGLGVIHTGLAYVVLYTGVARLPAARIAPLQSVYPLTAFVADATVYGRSLEAVQWFGALLLASAM
jgi:drug/metabolite transporter (DMT)-like permease